jgi:hypothetical protein
MMFMNFVYSKATVVLNSMVEMLDPGSIPSVFLDTVARVVKSWLDWGSCLIIGRVAKRRSALLVYLVSPAVPDSVPRVPV